MLPAVDGAAARVQVGVCGGCPRSWQFPRAAHFACLSASLQSSRGGSLVYSDPVAHRGWAGPQPRLQAVGVSRAARLLGRTGAGCETAPQEARHFSGRLSRKATMQVLECVAPGPDEVVLPKTSSSVFLSTCLDYLLRNLGVRQLVLCGCVTGLRGSRRQPSRASRPPLVPGSQYARLLVSGAPGFPPNSQTNASSMPFAMRATWATRSPWWGTRAPPTRRSGRTPRCQRWQATADSAPLRSCWQKLMR